jgi:hypothetical protein
MGAEEEVFMDQHLQIRQEKLVVQVVVLVPVKVLPPVEVLQQTIQDQHNKDIQVEQAKLVHIMVAVVAAALVE